VPLPGEKTEQRHIFGFDAPFGGRVKQAGCCFNVNLKTKRMTDISQTQAGFKAF